MRNNVLMWAWEIRNALGLLLMPPGSILVVALAGLAIIGRRRALGLGLVGTSLLALYCLSVPYVANALLASLEPRFADPSGDRRGEAIVVLGGGTYRGAPEYGGADTVNGHLLARLRYCAKLHRELGKPVLVSGGAALGEPVPEAYKMKQALEGVFDVPVRWVEHGSTTTEENALQSYRLLSPEGVKAIYLVTHAWHMRRAQWSFERAGFTVIPAPTLFTTAGARKVVDFLPRADALEASSLYVHETVGLAWYRLKSLFTAGLPAPVSGAL